MESIRTHSINNYAPQSTINQNDQPFLGFRLKLQKKSI